MIVKISTLLSHLKRGEMAESELEQADIVSSLTAGAQLSRDILFHFWQKYFFS